MDADMRRYRIFSYSVLLSLSFLLLAGCACSQCVDCGDNDTCTKDWCNETQCQHDPQICDQSGSSDRWRRRTTGEAASAMDRLRPNRVENSEYAIQSRFDDGKVRMQIGANDGVPIRFSCDNAKRAVTAMPAPQIPGPDGLQRSCSMR